MPTYEYVDVESGERVELWRAVEERTRIGDVEEVDGRRLLRVAEGGQMAVVEREYRFQTIQARPWCPGARAYNTDRGSLDYGQPLFRSKAELREFVARNRHEFAWNGPRL